MPHALAKCRQVERDDHRGRDLPGEPVGGQVLEQLDEAQTVLVSPATGGSGWPGPAPAGGGQLLHGLAQHRCRERGHREVSGRGAVPVVVHRQSRRGQGDLLLGTQEAVLMEDDLVPVGRHRTECSPSDRPKPSWVAVARLLDQRPLDRGALVGRERTRQLGRRGGNDAGVLRRQVPGRERLPCLVEVVTEPARQRHVTRRRSRLLQRHGRRPGTRVGVRSPLADLVPLGGRQHCQPQRLHPRQEAVHLAEGRAQVGAHREAPVVSPPGIEDVVHRSHHQRRRTRRTRDSCDRYRSFDCRHCPHACHSIRTFVRKSSHPQPVLRPASTARHTSRWARLGSRR
ncbi:hypothetical protein BJ986_000947 [Phycicoccus badiiscoriae]|uniref:Uncharacterized protein n=1 Tax=Pedococcus badiiscoriae TaxID=642776 RepID=A0A852WCP4_9MICO|nr:hypothetical protein [Pedococcus badiiscoriae]